MSEDSNVPSNPTGEVRPRSHKLATKQARDGFAMPRERGDDPSAAFEGLLRVALCSQQEHPGHGTGATWEMSAGMCSIPSWASARPTWVS
jgi:hypothetical protein